MTGGVVVDHHVAEGGGNQDGRHRVPVAPGQRFHLDHQFRLVGASQEEYLVAAGSAMAVRICSRAFSEK